jgi:O-antigen ligase
VKLHQRLFQILVFLLPTQLAFHFWPSWASVFGIRVDYLAPKVYLTDIVFVLLFISWRNKKISPWLLLLPLLALVNILGVANWQISLIGWLRVFEAGLLANYVSENWRVLKSKVSLPLSLAIGLTFFLSLVQLLSQKTLGGPFWFLGERSFSATSPGIALFNLFGRQLMRPYASFGHPNQMAGFVLTSLPLIGGWGVLFGFLTLIASFSKGALASLVVIGLIFLFRKRLKSSLKILPVGLVVISLFLPVVALKNSCSYPRSVSQRLELSALAGEIFGQQPITGVGLGNFIPSAAFKPGISWFLQPVHNIYLLVAAETGLLGLLVFSCLLFKLMKKLLAKEKWGLAFSLLAILLTGLVDHYWLTLQQTQLLFAIVIGAGLTKDEKRN